MAEPNKIAILVLVTMSRALAALCAFTAMLAVPAPAPTRTAVVVFSPWELGPLKDGFKVMRESTGSCGGRSLVTDRADAWRCFEGNDIDDPCFATSASNTVVACVQSPFSKRVVLLTLGKPLAGGEDATSRWLQPHGEPWGLRLVNGGTCVFVWGATDAVAGERMNYACTEAGWIIGAPDRSTAIWTARAVAWPNKGIKLVRIAVAIF